MRKTVFEEPGTKVTVYRDDSKSTEHLTIEGSVYQLVFQTDENYWSLGTFRYLADAARIARDGNKWIDPDDLEKRDCGFQIREHKIIAGVNPDKPWSRQDFIDELDADGLEVVDWFLPEPDPEEQP